MLATVLTSLTTTGHQVRSPNPHKKLVIVHSLAVKLAHPEDEAVTLEDDESKQQVEQMNADEEIVPEPCPSILCDGRSGNHVSVA